MHVSWPSFAFYGATLLPLLRLAQAAALPDLYEATVTELQAGLTAGDFTSVDLVNAYIARIKEVNEELHAVIEISPTALAQAAALDDQRKQGKTLGPLHGIPILIKDNIATRVEDGMNTTAGSYALLNSVVPGDSTLVVKLKAAGAIILGKTNLSEWAGSGSIMQGGWSARGGQTTCPYYPKCDPGGSSSGSAVAASVGLASVTVGTDTEGSIIGPASLNNVVGVRPTVGLTSRSGVIPITQHQDTVGPISRTVYDAALLLNAMAGPDAADNYTLVQPSTLPDYTAALTKDALKGVRLGVPRASLDPKWGPTPWAPAFKIALETLQELGAVITDPADVSGADEAFLSPSRPLVRSTDFRFDLEAYLATLKNNPNDIHTNLDIIAFNDAHKELEEPELDTYVEWNFFFEGIETLERDSNYTAALEKNRALGQTLDATLQQYNLDALVLPPAGPVLNLPPLVGYPVVIVPLGFDTNTTDVEPGLSADSTIGNYPNMPFGMTFVGSAWSDARLLAYAYAYEQATQTRLQLSAYQEATPKTQLIDVIAKR